MLEVRASIYPKMIPVETAQWPRRAVRFSGSHSQAGAGPLNCPDRFAAPSQMFNCGRVLVALGLHEALLVR